MPEIKNNFLKGRMNQDLDSRILPIGEYREAINLLISRSEGATVGEFENVLGNTNVGTISAAARASVIGHHVDETNNKVFIFATTFSNTDPNSRANSSQICLIMEFELTTTPTTGTILVSGNWLNFNKEFPIYGVNLLEDLLFWTDNFNQPRKINITTAYNDASAYTKEEQISVAKYYPWNTIIPMDRSAGIYSSGEGTTTLVVTQALANVKVGDILSDHNKGPGTTEIFNGPTNTQGVITVTKVNSTTNFTVSETLPTTAEGLVAGFQIDFSRTSMTNVHDPYVSNWSTQKIKTVQSNTIVRIGVYNDQTNYPVNFGGIPRAGDLITKTPNANQIPTNLRIAEVAIKSDPSTTSWLWQLTFDQDATDGGNLTGFAVDDEMIIGHNENYNVDAPGDPNFLDDKFVRFSYRFKFNDNEYSLMAPFSQIMFIPKQYGEFGLGQVDGKTEDDIENYYQDEIDAYTSTIIEWFENNIDTIDLKIPFPDTKANIRNIFDIKKIDILYKESDALSVKVLDTVEIDNIENTAMSTISYDDDINGLKTQNFYNYTYKSSKPYKTLPENQTVRVYDKVPIKALGQELISNRIVYGNFLERTTPPNSIKYSAGFSPRNIVTDFYTQYPYHSVKANRTYQVGIVLVDYFGRQSDVILSTYDDSSTLSGSSIFVPYNSSSEQTANQGVLGYIGENLTLTIDEEIATSPNAALGEPGLYRPEGWVESVLAITDADDGYVTGITYNTTGGSGSGCTVRVNAIVGTGEIDGLTIMTAGSGYDQGDELTVDGGDGLGTFTVNVGEANPLGWYSYKIVVKQQEQEYYNVFLPGFVNGYPVKNRTRNLSTSQWDFNETQRGKLSFSTVLGENINKIPRNLNEVGPTDREFNSDEILYIRVNNPDVTKTSAVLEPYVTNLQYYPGGNAQNVLNISTVRESELAAIPFVANSSPTVGPFGFKGEYGAVRTTNLTPGASVYTSSEYLGSIPWGDVADKQSFFGAEQNPFIMQFSTAANYANSIGAIVSGEGDTNYTVPTYPTTVAMQPILSIAETEPVMSVLELFYETSSNGLIEVLNSSVIATYNGAVSITNTTGTFLESVANSAELGNVFKFVNGSGIEITSNIASVTINKAVRQNAPTIDISSLFSIGAPSGGSAGEYTIKANSYFWYGENSAANPSSDVYIFDLKIVSGATSEYEDTLTNVLTLTLDNVIPAIYTDSNYTTILPTPQWTLSTNPQVGDTTVAQLYGANGTNLSNTANRTNELAWEVTAVTPIGQINDFSFSNTTPGLLTCQNLVDKTQYDISISLTDVAGNGLTKTGNIRFTAGAAYAPTAICAGRASSGYMGPNAANNSACYFIGNDGAYTTTQAGSGSPFGLTPNYLYNAQAVNNSSTCTWQTGNGCCTAWVFEGSIMLAPTLAVDTTYAGDASIYFRIQYRTNTTGNNQGAWTEIASSTNLPSGSWDTYGSGGTYPNIQLTGSTNAGAASIIAQKHYYFDQPGEYRVLTGTLTGSGANNARFYVDFSDGDYGSYPGPKTCTGNTKCNPDS